MNQCECCFRPDSRGDYSRIGTEISLCQDCNDLCDNPEDGCDRVPLTFAPGDHVSIVHRNSEGMGIWHGRKAVVLKEGAESYSTLVHIQLTDGLRPDDHGDTPFFWDAAALVLLAPSLEEVEAAIASIKEVTHERG